MGLEFGWRAMATRVLVLAHRRAKNPWRRTSTLRQSANIAGAQRRAATPFMSLKLG
jgi:hypothetical protein